MNYTPNSIEIHSAWFENNNQFKAKVNETISLLMELHQCVVGSYEEMDGDDTIGLIEFFPMGAILLPLWVTTREFEETVSKRAKERKI